MYTASSGANVRLPLFRRGTFYYSCAVGFCQTSAQAQAHGPHRYFPGGRPGLYGYMKPHSPLPSRLALVLELPGFPVLIGLCAVLPHRKGVIAVVAGQDPHLRLGVYGRGQQGEHIPGPLGTPGRQGLKLQDIPGAQGHNAGIGGIAAASPIRSAHPGIQVCV